MSEDVTKVVDAPLAGHATLALEDVTTYLRVGRELRPVILRVDLRIEPGEIVGLVGESGSGKSMTARTIAGVLPKGAVTEGSLRLGGEDLLAMTHRRRREIQAKQIGMVFQDPRAYIDPLWRVEVHMTEAMRVHLGYSRSRARERAVELLTAVGLDLALADIVCDRVCVMYAGRIVEVRDGRQIFDDPIHPYTIDLLAARPSIARRVDRLPVIRGVPTSAMDAPEGCPFHPRCRFAEDACRRGVPTLVAVRGGFARCFRAHEDLRHMVAPDSAPPGVSHAS